MADQPATELDVYARVSRVGDDRQRSTEGQVADCRARILERGAKVGEVHVDHGRSAWRTGVKRPGWDTLMVRLETGASGGVIVFDLARFSRRPIEGERLIAAAERGLLILDSEGEYDLTSPSGKKAFRDQLASAAYESDRLSTRVARGKKLKAFAGESNAPRRGFGFRADGTLDPAEAAIVRDLAAKLLRGDSQDAMIIDLNKRGIKTSLGGKWNRPGLRQVLTRAANVGKIVYRGEVVADRATPGETLLSLETWERVVALYASRRTGRPASGAYLLSGIARCGLCDQALTGRPYRARAPYPDGEPRRQYMCQVRPINSGCGKIFVDVRELDRHVAALTIAILSDRRHAAAVEAATRAAVKAREKLEGQISEAEVLAEELTGRLGRQEITLARYDVAVAPLDRRIKDLKRQLEELGADDTAPAPPAVVAATREEWRERWDDPDTTVEQRRQFVRYALRGRKLRVMPADRTAARVFDPNRIVVDAAS